MHIWEKVMYAWKHILACIIIIIERGKNMNQPTCLLPSVDVKPVSVFEPQCVFMQVKFPKYACAIYLYGWTGFNVYRYINAGMRERAWYMGMPDCVSLYVCKQTFLCDCTHVFIYL